MGNGGSLNFFKQRFLAPFFDWRNMGDRIIERAVELKRKLVWGDFHSEFSWRIGERCGKIKGMKFAFLVHPRDLRDVYKKDCTTQI